MAKEEMSVSEYSKLRGISRAAVNKQLLNGRALPGVLRHRKVANVYILTVDPEKVKEK